MAFISFHHNPFAFVHRWLALPLLLLLAPPYKAGHRPICAAVSIGWEELDSKLPKPISDHTATRYGQVVYLAGGCDAERGNTWDEEARRFLCLRVSRSFYSFDLSDASNVTTVLPDMPIPRYRHAAVAVNNKVFLVGGRDVNDETIVEQVDVFDIASKSWSTVGNLSEEYLTSDLTGFGWQNRHAYFVGGYNATYAAMSSVFSLDATAEDPLAAITRHSDMNVERGDISSAIDETNGYVLVAGGFTDRNGFCEAHSHAELYNINTDEWTEVAPLQHGRADKALVHLDGDDGIFYAMGGERQVAGFCDLRVEPFPGERTIPINQVERYDQASNRWETVANLPEHRFRFAAVARGNAVYTFGGQVAFDQSCDCFSTTASIVVYTEVDKSAAVAQSHLGNAFLVAATSVAWLLLG